MSSATVSSGREILLRFIRVAGAVVGYGSLAAFLYLVSVQIHAWFRDGEWTHFGVNQGLHEGLIRCCVKDGDTGRLADFVQWLDTPVTWIGLHKVLEIMPASLALFAISILGNCVFVYCQDRIADVET